MTDREFLPGPDEMQAFDRASIEGGIPGIELMERAGSAAARFILSDSCSTLGKEVLVFCGPGNNGGDGLVVARKLIAKGIPPTIIVANAQRYSDDFISNLTRLTDYKKIYLFCTSNVDNPVALSLPQINEEQLVAKISSARLVIDALLGTGQESAPREDIALLSQVFKKYRKEQVRVYAIDIPTGVNSSTGQIYENCIAADSTLCIEFIKRGLVQYPAREICGELVRLPIGIKAQQAPQFRRLSPLDFSKIKRPANAHKNSVGRVLVVGGSESMPGALQLAARSALSAGAGLVHCFCPQGVESGQATTPELIWHRGKGQSQFTAKDYAIFRSLLSEVDALVIGPGAGNAADTRQFIERVLLSVDSPTVIDADALNIMAGLMRGKSSLRLKENWVYTPHPGEFARLISSDSDHVQQDRYQVHLDFTRQYPGTLVLKGAGTIVGEHGSGVVQTEGNHYLATAGSGDVLAGIIGSFLAQGMSVSEAARAGVYIHGLAADCLMYDGSGPFLAGALIDVLGPLVAAHIHDCNA